MEPKTFLRANRLEVRSNRRYESVGIISRKSDFLLQDCKI